MFGEPVSTGASARALDQSGAPQRHEKLLQIGERQVLAFRNRRQRHRCLIGVAGEIRHRHDRVTAFRCQFHDLSPD
jgi:hypothetical protein